MGQRQFGLVRAHLQSRRCPLGPRVQRENMRGRGEGAGAGEERRVQLWAEGSWSSKGPGCPEASPCGFALVRCDQVVVVHVVRQAGVSAGW